jgi:hypothetical protein
VSRWLVSNVPGLLLLLGLIVVIVGTAIGLQAYLRHRSVQVKSDATKFIPVLATVFAFSAGFLINNLWGQINTADAKIRDEGAAGVQLARDLAAFDKADQDRLRQSLLEYERAAEAEWSLSVQGQSSTAASDALWRVYETYGNVETRNEFQKTLLSTSFANLDKISQARSERVFTAATDLGPPWSVWAVIFLLGGLIMGWSIVLGVTDTQMRFPVVATVGAVVAGQVFLILQLSHPYVGEIGTSPEPLREAIRVLTAPPP